MTEFDVKWGYIAVVGFKIIDARKLYNKVVKEGGSEQSTYLFEKMTELIGLISALLRET